MNKITPYFTNKLKAWNAYDLKAQELKTQLNALNEEKDKLSVEILGYIKNNNLQKTAINLGNKKIYYYEDQQYNNLSFGFLKECLLVYFNNDDSKTEQLCNFIKSKRIKTNKPILKSVNKKIKK